MLRYDHYKLLGIARDSTLVQIKRAYREKVKNCHPDVNASPRASAAFRAVHEAYRVLSDPHDRLIYDHRLQHYRLTSEIKQEQYQARKYGHSWHSKKPVEPVPDHQPAPSRVDRFAFTGLHLTGLLFGLALVSGILIGITFQGWPFSTLIFTILGIAVLPDSLHGLRASAHHTAH
ncbi:MAG: J domain-containing protein [Bacteroidota bacterium]|nr:J domain-containing protein [Bacteroidota bacterium]